MKIAVLTGSPNKNGSSNMLAQHFIRGAEENGHHIEVIDAAGVKVSPCTGCVTCGSPSMTKNSGYPEKAYELGRSV